MWVHVFRVKGLHTGAWSFTGTWGGKEGWSKASVLGFQFFVFGSYLTPTLFYSLLHLCFLIFFPTASGVAQKVTQDQPDISSQVGESAAMNCQYETSWNSYNIFWYKQLPSGEMTLRIRQESSGPNARNGRYSVNFQRAQNSISLTISAL